MFRSTLAIAVSLALGACSNAPKVQTPSGGSRIQVNSDAALTQLAALGATTEKSNMEALAEAKRRSDLEAQVKALEKTVGDLKTYILLKAVETDINTPKGVPLPSATQPPASAPKKGDSKLSAPKTGKAPASAETVGYTAGQMAQIAAESGETLTTRYAFAATSFNADQAFKTQLLDAAAKSSYIMIRGYTDSSVPTQGNRQVAYQRALSTYRFLVKSGVPAEKIKMRFFPAGQFETANVTADDRAQNRRVEIQILGAIASSQPRT